MIQFACHRCGKQMSVRDEHAGRQGKCACGAVIVVPTPVVPPTMSAVVPQAKVAPPPPLPSSKNARTWQWVFGVLLAMAGLGSLGTTPLAAPFVFLAAAALLPPVWDIAKSRMLAGYVGGETASTAVRIVIVVVGLLLFGLVNNAMRPASPAGQTGSGKDTLANAQRSDGQTPSPVPARSTKTITTGSDARLRTPKNDDVPMCTTEADYDRVVKLATANDTVGIEQLMREGRAWTVPSGTLCKVIDRGFFKSEVRILEGRRSGISGWVSSDFLSDAGGPDAGVAAGARHSPNGSVRITRAEYGSAWPFTVAEGVLAGAERPGGTGRTRIVEVTFTTGGVTYAVNGTAKANKRYTEIDAIWADDPALAGLKVNIGPIIDRGLKLADGVDQPYVAPKPAPAPPPVVGGPIRCDQFDVSAQFDGAGVGGSKRVRVSIRTDLPDDTEVMVSIDRSFVNSADNEEYAIAYLDEKSTVGQWRGGRTVELDQAKWQAKLNDKRETFRKIGEKLVVTRLDDAVAVSFVVPINQSNKRFGLRNANLVGKAVEDSSGLKIVRREAKLVWVVQVQ